LIRSKPSWLSAAAAAAAAAAATATATLATAAGLLACMSATAAVFELPPDGGAIIGEDEHVRSKYEDTLLEIAHRHSLGYEEILRANPKVDMWLPGDGTDILLPGRRILPAGPREGIVINLPEHRLYFYPKPKRGEKPVVYTYPVSIGRMDWRSPLGETRVIGKERNPSWYPPESVRKEHAANGDPLPKVVPPGPDNPLGAFKMRLAVGNGTYEIHGTNNPVAVGLAVTHGCIRMYPEDVADLFPRVAIGTKVWLLNEPVKVTYVDGELYVEAHPPVDAQGQTVEPDLALLSQKLEGLLADKIVAIRWDYARDALAAATGMPTLVGLEANFDPTAPAPSGAPAEGSAGSGNADAGTAGTAAAGAPEAPNTGPSAGSAGTNPAGTDPAGSEPGGTEPAG
jgi:L,D-transpeptidase ErfK/SrfK